MLISVSLVIVSFIGIAAGIMGSVCSSGSELPVLWNYGSPVNPGASTDQQDKDLGIGPVKSVKLGPIDKKMGDEGKSLFNTKCIVCHELDQKKVGPPLRNVTKERAPEYIMNLLVNAQQMQKEDPIVKDLFRKYNNVPMPDPVFTQAQARSVLEYLRSVVK